MRNGGSPVAPEGPGNLREIGRSEYPENRSDRVVSVATRWEEDAYAANDLRAHSLLRVPSFEQRSQFSPEVSVTVALARRTSFERVEERGERDVRESKCSEYKAKDHVFSPNGRYWQLNAMRAPACRGVFHPNSNN